MHFKIYLIKKVAPLGYVFLFYGLISFLNSILCQKKRETERTRKIRGKKHFFKGIVVKMFVVLFILWSLILSLVSHSSDSLVNSSHSLIDH